MAEPARSAATYQDLVRLPEHMVGEIIDGDLYASPRPGPRHANASSMLGGDLSGAFGRSKGGPGNPGGWWILDEPELHLGDDVLVPNLAGWKRERMPRLPDEAFFTIAPDWVCEVISPSTERIDRALKKRIYAREGVRYLWLINPLAQTLEALRLEGQFWQEVGTYSGGERARVEPFEAVELDMTDWWDVGP